MHANSRAHLCSAWPLDDGLDDHIAMDQSLSIEAPDGTPANELGLIVWPPRTHASKQLIFA